MTKNTITFKEILKRSNSKIQSERANRISKRASGEYTSLINKAENQVMDIEDSLEAMSDISTSNVSTSVNSIKGATFDAKAFVEKRANLKKILALAIEELELLKEDESFYN